MSWLCLRGDFVVTGGLAVPSEGQQSGLQQEEGSLVHGELPEGPVSFTCCREHNPELQFLFFFSHSGVWEPTS